MPYPSSKTRSYLIDDDDAVIIMESGHEKLRYLIGSALVITNRDIEYLDVGTLAVKKASEMLGVDFTTRLEY